MISHIDIGYNGRLGNQLFIYALLFKLKSQDKEIVIPSKNYNWKQDGCLDQHHKKWIAYKYVLDDYFDLSIKPSNNIPNKIWEEPCQGYHSDVFSLNDVSLKGYFQSWKYFEDVKEDLKKELTFKSNIREKVNSIFSKYSYKKTVCIHIRLGDTLAQPWMHKLSPEYIQKCFQHLPLEDYNYIIVSDNFEYCKEWFPQDDTVFFAENLNEAETLYLMTLCDHFIMSGSTFSWWGAYLGQKSHSIVLFPDYFDGSTRSLDEFYHPSWKRILIKQNHNLIISRYNENVDWCTDIPSDNCKVFLYNKGGKLPYHSVNLQNVGREAHTYLTYIIQNYNNLANYNWFFQGNPFDHIDGLQWIIQNVSVNLPCDYIEFNVEQKDLIDDHWHTVLKHTPEADTILKLIGINDISDTINCGAQFMASKKVIHSRPLSFYQQMLSITEQTNSSPWILERVWRHVFLNELKYTKTNDGKKVLYKIV